MANDRVYLRCTTCKATRLMFKFWGAGRIGDIFPNYPESIPVDSFVEKHLRECRMGMGMDLARDAGFDIITEDDLPPVKPQ